MTLQLKNISKSFKGEVVINDVSLSIKRGETLVLFGPSGAGKTVLLRLIAGVIEPDTGIIEVNEKDMVDVEIEDRGIGMAFQNFALFPHMDAFENIAAPLTARRQSRTMIKSGVETLAKLLKIEHVLSHKPKELSNGQKQRTALARALAGAPSILLLDDPLRNVDAKLRFEMRLELPRLLKSQNATTIYVTQDYKEAMAFGNHIAVMNNHGIQQIGTPEEIYLKPANIEIARLFGDPVINVLDVIPEKGAAGIQVKLSGVPVKINNGYAHTVGQKCFLAIRPEAIQFVKESTPGAFPVTVNAETPLNEKTVSLTKTENGREIMVSRPAGTAAVELGLAYIKIDVRNGLLFEKSSGNLIKARSIRKGDA